MCATCGRSGPAQQRWSVLKPKDTIDSMSSSWVLAARMSRFMGYRVNLVNGPNICCRKPPDLYVSSAKSARARNSKSECV